MKRKLLVPGILVIVGAAAISAYTVPITVSGGKEAAPKLGSPAYSEALQSIKISSSPIRTTLTLLVQQ